LNSVCVAIKLHLLEVEFFYASFLCFIK
jgi:hypothetical protein